LTRAARAGDRRGASPAPGDALRDEPGGGPWQIAVARLVAAGAGPDAAPALVAAIDAVVDHQGICLLAFHRDRPPDVVHHSLEPAGVRHYVDRYLAGPYLLDPLYQLALAAAKPGVCRYRDATPDRFRSSEYYRQYCERTHLGDEMDFLLDADEGTALALVVARRQRRFTRGDIGRLQRIEAIVHAAMRNAWLAWRPRPRAPDDGSLHRRLTECFENFGGSVLTEREQQITRLLLRGFSTKAIARELDIAPGTVMVHKRNLFAKLGITSQFELFSQFIDALSA
jgi:DNA-binding CsgD family transcriptional regulator